MDRWTSSSAGAGKQTASKRIHAGIHAGGEKKLQRQTSLYLLCAYIHEGQLVSHLSVHTAHAYLTCALLKSCSIMPATICSLLCHGLKCTLLVTSTFALLGACLGLKSEFNWAEWKSSEAELSWSSSWDSVLSHLSSFPHLPLYYFLRYDCFGFWFSQNSTYNNPDKAVQSK